MEITSPPRKTPGFLSQVTWSGIPFQSRRVCYLLRRIDECPGIPEIACICITWGFSYTRKETAGGIKDVDYMRRLSEDSRAPMPVVDILMQHMQQVCMHWPCSVQPHGLFTCPLGRRIA